MISEIRIRNFKSIQDLTLKLGRVTVLIGENGSGKSNILEAIGFAGCAAAGKLDNAVLASRGIRVCEPGWMTAAFGEGETGSSDQEQSIGFEVRGADGFREVEYNVSALRISPDPSSITWQTLPLWHGKTTPQPGELERALGTPGFSQRLGGFVSFFLSRISPDQLRNPDSGKEITEDEVKAALAVPFLSVERLKELEGLGGELALSDFMIYAPENTLLRTPSPESAVLPLGSKGEGLFRHLESFGEPENEAQLKDMKERLKIFGWFEDFLAPDSAAVTQARLQIRDRWLAPGRAVIDQRSANEGFLYLLFYFALMMSSRTPRFFAIDNLDNALNPKLCAALMRQIAELAVRYDKQVICTTHNPAILDGLDLRDDAQRLYSVQRNEDGQTTLNRVRAPKPQPGQVPMKLSAAFLAGHIGGLPEHF